MCGAQPTQGIARCTAGQQLQVSDAICSQYSLAARWQLTLHGQGRFNPLLRNPLNRKQNTLSWRGVARVSTDARP
jgi:hypothetical protein